MACGGSNRLRAYVEKLYQFGHFTRLQKKISTMTCAKSASRTNGVLQHYQNKTNKHDSKITLARATSTMQMPGSSWMSDCKIDPYKLVKEDFKDIVNHIRLQLSDNTSQEALQTMSTYYLDGQGKLIRPVFTILIARAINYHKGRNVLLQSQWQIAILSEMIHTASLLHDDIVDNTGIRRSKPSVNVIWNPSKIVFAGDYILAIIFMMLSKIQNNKVIIIIMQIIYDIIEGEFMQLGFRETDNERFAHYFTKTYLKTATLFANCNKAVAILSEVDDHIIEMAFQYGKNIGLAFSLMDDVLDFVASTKDMGKSTAIDLKLGIATAPVLFACKQYPELNAMIMRRFQEPGDIEKTFELVHKSDGLEETRVLAKKYCAEASKIAKSFIKSPYQQALITMADLVSNRMK